MLNLELCKPLFELSLAIEQSKKELASNPSSERASELEKSIQDLGGKIYEKSTALINKTVDQWSSKEPLSSFLSVELEALKTSADASWHSAIDDVKKRLINLADIEAKKSPIRRKIEKNAVGILIVLVVAIVLSLKWHWLIEVDEPIEASTGVVQRAKVLEKVLEYDHSMGVFVRRGGWLKGIIYWPIEPTDDEIKHASEFLWSVVGVYDYMQKESLLCGSQLHHDSSDKDIKDEVVIAQVVIDDLKTADPKSEKNGALLVANSFMKKFPCK